MTMQPSAEDIEAARLLLGNVRPMHENMKGLPGAGLCDHLLAGSGRELASFGDRGTVDSWANRPYRHHLFVKDPTKSPDWCKCGNGRETNGIHTPCWREGELK